MYTRTMGAEPKTHFRVGFDDLTTARLLELADHCQTDPNSIIAAIVRDVLEDDAAAHDGPFVAMRVQ
jgi:hypothetical protein